MDYFEGQDLYDWVQNLNYTLDPLSLKVIFTKLTEAIKSLHEYGIAHRDIKPENVLIQEDSTATNFYDRYTIKIIDFGLTCYNDLKNSCANSGGTKIYIAPEVLTAENDFVMSKASDVYSLGLTFQYISSLKNSQIKIEQDYLKLYANDNSVSFQSFLINQKILSGYSWMGQIPNLSDEKVEEYEIIFNQLIEDMVQMDYTLRPTTQDILNVLDNEELYYYEGTFYNKYRLCLILKGIDYNPIPEGDFISMQMDGYTIRNILEKYTNSNYVSEVGSREKRIMALYLNLSPTSGDREIRKALEYKFNKTRAVETLEAMAEHFYTLYSTGEDRQESIIYYNFLSFISNGGYLVPIIDRLRSEGNPIN